MTRSDSIQDRANFLVNTSVEDMQSSLYSYTYLNISDVQTIRLGLAMCKRRGEKTKVKLLERKLKRMEKDLAKAKALFNHPLDLPNASKPHEEGLSVKVEEG